MPNETISRAGALAKLYDINGSEIHQQVKRETFRQCDPSNSFFDGASGCRVPYDRASFCNNPVRVASDLCEITLDCSPYVISQSQVTTYYTYSYTHYYTNVCGAWDDCNTRTESAILYAIGSTKNLVNSTIGTVQSYRLYNNDGTDVRVSRNCKAINDCTPALTQFTGASFTYYRPVDDAEFGCVGRATIARWNAVKQSVDDYCNYVAPTDPPTTQPVTQPTTQPPVTQPPATGQVTPPNSGTGAPTNPSGNSRGVDVAPSASRAFNNVVSVDVLPSNSQDIQQTRTMLLPSVAPTTPAENGLALLGLLAIAPVGLGIVAAGVGAYGLYKYCYPDKEEEDIEEAQSPQETQESAVAETSFNEPEDELVEEYVETKPLPAQSNWFSLAKIGNWFTRMPAPEPVNEIESQSIDEHVYEDADENIYEEVKEPVEERVELKPLPTQGWGISLSGIANWFTRKSEVEPVNENELQTKETV